MKTKRLRIFAGPNGSGKTTIYKAVSSKVNCTHFVNADLIEKQLLSEGSFSFDQFDIIVNSGDFKEAFSQSGLFAKTKNGRSLLNDLTITADNTLVVKRKELVDSYFAAFVADFLRLNMLNLVESFSIETVMSDPGKLEYIRLAKKLGYRIYLYFVATVDFNINIDRVSQRVSTGGHDVPDEKIINRYAKSLELVYDATMLSDRAFFFDNSGNEYRLLAEYDSGNLIPYEQFVPEWFMDNIYKRIL